MEIVKVESERLNQLGKTEGVMTGILVFQFAVSDLVEYLCDPNYPWSDYQMAECGALAYNEAHWLSLAELKLFCTRVKTSYYTSNQNFKPAVFMIWLQQFLSELLSARGEYNMQKEKEAIRLREQQREEMADAVPKERIDALFEEFKAALAPQLELEAQERETAFQENRERFNKFMSKEEADAILTELEKHKSKK